MITLYRLTDAPAFRSDYGLWFCPRCSGSIAITGIVDVSMTPVSQEEIDADNARHKPYEPNRCQDCGEVL